MPDEVRQSGLPPLVRFARSRCAFACNDCMKRSQPCESCAERRTRLTQSALRERRKVVAWLDDKQTSFYESGRKHSNRDEIARGAEFLRMRLAVQRGEHDVAV